MDVMFNKVLGEMGTVKLNISIYNKKNAIAEAMYLKADK